VVNKSTPGLRKDIKNRGKIYNTMLCVKGEIKAKKVHVE
jgi:hypothetical protein